MKTALIIPIKLNNKRLPGKNIKPFDDGTPLINCILNTVQQVNNVDEKYVYCSDLSIQEYIPYGIKFLQRDKSLDSDNANFQQLVQAFLAEIPVDICLLTYATAPFVKKETLETCAHMVQTGNYDSAFTARKMYEFLWMDGKPLNFDEDNRRRSQDLAPIYLETGGCNTVTRKSFLQTFRRVGAKPYIHEIDEIESIDIDNPNDFVLANAVYMNLISKKIKK